jgi:hypothetical protein
MVNGLIAQLDPDRTVTFTEVGQAADRLAAMLAKGPRRLLILDDVWRGAEAELSFTAPHQLLLPVADAAGRLPGRQRAALLGAFGKGDLDAPGLLASSSPRSAIRFVSWSARDRCPVLDHEGRWML